MNHAIDVVTVGSLFVELTPTIPGETLATARDYMLVAGGAAANVAFALARLGVRVQFITAVGDDEFGTFAINALVEFGVDTTGVRRVPEQLTPVSFSAVDQQGGKVFRFYRFPGHSTPMQALVPDDFSAITTGRVFDFSEGSLREPTLRPLVLAAARSARANGVPVIYAVNLRRDSWHLPDEEIRRVECEAIELADIVVLNADELAFITGSTGNAGLRSLQARGPQVVVMTRGGEDTIVVRVGERCTEIAPYRVSVVYDVGAGDTFHAGLVAAEIDREQVGVVRGRERHRIGNHERPLDAHALGAGDR